MILTVSITTFHRNKNYNFNLSINVEKGFSSVIVLNSDKLFVLVVIKGNKNVK